MKTHPNPFSRACLLASHQRGIAIVVVVSLMALLSVMVLGLFMLTSTNRQTASNDTSARQADSIAKAAKETIVADLIAEMKAGAGNTTTTPDGKFSFTVENPKAMVPSRSLKGGVEADPNFKLLVKQSANGTPFFSISGGTPSNRASSISTTKTAVDGRSVAASRWSDPKFFAPGGNLTNTQVPDWVYIARNATNPTSVSPANTLSTSAGTPNPQYEVGRYAYQVYDVSGLLDINVAGSTSTLPPADVLSRKGSLAWMDFTTLGTNLSKVADWRRTSSSGQNVEAFVKEWGGLKGWMRTPLVGGKSDNIFLSRKDLIAYQKLNPTVISEDLLPLFTTTSRELNQPSWSPSLDATVAGFEYKANKDKSTAANRRVEGVRVKEVFTRRDGKTAKVGEPLIRNRFPLSKIQAFADNNSAEVLKYFGLIPDQSAGGTVISWQRYGTSTGQNVVIKTLEQVAELKREPDFFETLKASLLEGSLGNCMAANSMFADVGRDNKIDYQVLRIGASIIDQYDADDNPTIIKNGPVNPLTLVSTDDVAGVENLPYIYFIGESRFRRRDVASPPNDSTACTFLTFQLWNPHKNPTVGKIAAGDYRIAFAGQSSMQWKTFNDITGGKPQQAGYYPYERISPIRTASFDTDYLSFKVDTTSMFSTPIYLKPGNASVTSSNPIDTISGGAAPVIGYRVGQVEAAYDTAVSHSDRYNSHGLFSNYPAPMTFALQKNIGGTWVNYQTIPEWSKTHGFGVGSLPGDTNRLYNNSGNFINLHGMLTDPRTTRYGISTTNPGDTAVVNTPNGSMQYANQFFPPITWTPVAEAVIAGKLTKVRVPDQYTTNTKGGTTVVVNRDGIRRPADGGTPFADPTQRPEILNRPFQSVADMGHAFRDDPWTTLNLFGDPEDATQPGDGALLDFFGLTETPIRAGVVNPNTAPQLVLKALLTQAAIREGSPLSSSLADTYATSIRAELDSKPMLNPAEIAILAGKIATEASIPGYKNKKDIQVIARALADVTSVRTWNLFVDVIAQSGKLTPAASSLDSFIAQAERRYWYHIAIDRFTGEIVSTLQENASE